MLLLSIKKPNTTPLSTHLIRHHKFIHQHPTDRNSDNLRKHYETKPSGPPNTTRTDELAWDNDKTELLRLQQQSHDPEKRLAMGAPSFGLMEIFLQHTEHPHMAQLSTKHKIINYFRYVDDILIKFDPSQSSIQAILADFNAFHTNLQFTAKTWEQCHKLPRHNYPQDSPLLENSNLQEANIDLHHNPIHV